MGVFHARDSRNRDPTSTAPRRNYDWMHCAFQAGFMSEAMWLAFKNIAILKFGSIGTGGDSMIGISETVPIPQSKR